MSATSQLTDFSDLYTDLQQRVRVQTGQTATENQAKRYINIALQDMHIGFSEPSTPWAEREATLVTQPEYNTGTASVAKGATAVTGAGTAWNSNNDFGVPNIRAGGKIIFGGAPEVYTVASVSSDTALVLSSAFVADTISAETYNYFEDEYALADDFLRPISWTSFSDAMEIELIDRNSFRQRYPRNKVTGRPVVAALVDKGFSGDTSPVRKVRFHKPPNKAFSIPYSYLTRNLAVTAAGVSADSLINDTDEPIVFLRFRHALVFHALYHWYRDKKNDTRGAAAKAEYTDIMLRITSDLDPAATRAAVRPAGKRYAARARRPWA